MGSYRFIEHTADIAVQITGNSLEDLFTSSAESWLESVTDKKSVASQEQKILKLTAHGIEELLVKFLNELNYLLLVKKWVYHSTIKMEINTNSDFPELTAEIKGEPLNFDKHFLKEEIKAITFHQLKIEEKNNTFFTQIVFDI